MAVLPDLAAAALYAGIVFLFAFGLLVVFAEPSRPRRGAASAVVCALASGVLALLGESGLALLPVALAGAILASYVFEALTNR